MNRPFQNPNVDSVGAPNFHKRWNFATAGSTKLPANVHFHLEFSWLLNCEPSFSFLFFSISYNDSSICWKWFLLTEKLIALDKKLQKYLPLEDYFKQGPCMFDAGQNDVDGVFNSQSEGHVTASFPATLSDFEAIIKVVLNCAGYFKIELQRR